MMSAEHRKFTYQIVAYAPEHSDLIDDMVPVSRRFEFLGQ